MVAKLRKAMVNYIAIAMLVLGVLLGSLTYSYVHASSYVTSFSEKSFRNDHISVEIEGIEDRVLTKFGKLVALHSIGIQVYDDSKGRWIELPWTEPPKVVKIFDRGTKHFVVKHGIAGNLVDVSIIYMASRASYRSEPLKIAVVVHGLREENTSVRIVWRFKLEPLLVHKLRLFNPMLQKLATLINKKIDTYRDITFKTLKSIPGTARDLIDKIENLKFSIPPRKARAFPAIQLFDKSGKLLMGFNYQDIALDLRQFTIDSRTYTMKLVFGDYVVNKHRVVTIDPYLDGGGGGISYAQYPIYDTEYIYDLSGNIITIMSVSVYGPPISASKEATQAWREKSLMKVGCGAGFIEDQHIKDVFSVRIEVGWSVLYDVTADTTYRYGDLLGLIHFTLEHDDFQEYSSRDYLEPLGSVIFNAIKSIAERLGIWEVTVLPNPFTFVPRGESGEVRGVLDVVAREYSGSCFTDSVGRNVCIGLESHGGGQYYEVWFEYPETFSPNHHAYVEMYAKARLCVIQHIADDTIYCGSKTIYWWVYLYPKSS